MAELAGVGHNIAYAVAYKAAVELIANGIAILETEDIGAEVAALADTLFDHYSSRLDPTESAPKTTRTSGRSSYSRNGGSTRRGSSSGGGSRGPKNPDGPASAAAQKYALGLLERKVHDYDDDFISDVRNLNAGEVSALIDELKDAPDFD